MQQDLLLSGQEKGLGKTADLVLVDDDPSQRLCDPRQTRKVMLEDKLMNADALCSVADSPGVRNSSNRN